jgi:hypothetical protein
MNMREELAIPRRISQVQLYFPALMLFALMPLCACADKPIEALAPTPANTAANRQTYKASTPMTLASQESKKRLIYSATKYERERFLIRKEEGIVSVETDRGLTKIPILIALIDLNGDHVNEIIVYLPTQEYCGSAGCSFSIYKQLGGEKLQQIFWTYSATGHVSVLGTATNGYKDIYIEGVRGNGQAWFDGKWIWNGKTYTPPVGKLN